ncbi:NUDIX hydrolase [Pseudactinotalea suaedae]|uniref:NUDIX hydrolase n=1 Tax=Pseudactinotalea suaedae TaxID=1524924 RepID=UPI0012E0E6E6|nr:NUDIX domain-containing protein [Pseudactinotalea suaedae]
MTESADGWVECRCGARHWGRSGAAGLLLTDGARVVLQHRAEWSHQGGTWGLPGGALHAEETAVAGALREAAEEAGIDAGRVRPVATSVLSHPDWSYTTVLARTDPGLHVEATDAESLEIRWVPMADVADRRLLPAFGDAWPDLRAMLDVDLQVVVDAANVVGSRPDGWWRDRRGAAERLLGSLETLAATGVPAAFAGLPGERWWPAWHVVVEGAARGAETSGTGRSAVEVVRASGSGDDTIVEVTTGLVQGGARAIVVTADRELAVRCGTAGATVVGPGSLLALVAPPSPGAPSPLA